MNQAIITRKQIIFISYILGGIFFLIFAGKIGNNGMGYMAMVLELLNLFLYLVGREITDFVAKMIRGKKAKGLHKDATNVKRRLLVIHFVTGTLLSLLFFILSGVFAEGLFKVPYIGICLRIISPLIFLQSMETVFLGAFQGSGSQMPTVICAFLRQLFFFGFGILFVGKCMNYGQKVSGLLMNQDFVGMYGAIGLCIAILIAEVLVFLFQLFLYIMSEGKRETKRSKEGLQTTEDLRTTLYYYYQKVILIFGSQLFFHLPLFVGMLYSLRTLEDPFAASHTLGSFYGLYLVLCMIPVMLTDAGTYMMQGKLSYYAGKQEHRGVRDCINAGLHYCVILAIFFGVIFFTLSGQITAVFMGAENAALAEYVKLGSVLIIFQITANFGMGLLKSMNQKYFVLICSFLGSMAGLFTCFIGKKSGFEVYDFMLYPMIFAALVCTVSSIGLVAFNRRVGMEPITAFVVPALCGSVVGLLMMLISKLMTPHLGNLVCLLICLIFGFILYVFLLGITRNIHENEISTMYGELGKRIVGLIFR